MNRVFRMSKMLARLEKEGRTNEVTPEALEFMKLLDGRVGTDYNWQSVVHDENLVYITGKDIPHGGAYVNFNDTEAV